MDRDGWFDAIRNDSEAFWAYLEQKVFDQAWSQYCWTATDTGDGVEMISSASDTRRHYEFIVPASPTHTAHGSSVGFTAERKELDSASVLETYLQAGPIEEYAAFMTYVGMDLEAVPLAWEQRPDGFTYRSEPGYAQSF